jgi:hypothetical protein
MSAGEDAARAGLGKSVDENRQQVAMTDESRVLLADLMEDRMRIAVAEGITAAMTDEAAERFWNKGLEVLQRQAKAKAGGFLLDGLATAAKKLLWIALFVGLAYSIGGWTLLKALWAAMNKGS